MTKTKLVTDGKNGFFSNNKITVGAAAPTTGTYTSGDMVMSSSPNSTAFGWVCTASGTPGSWKILKSADDIPAMSWNNITGKPSTYAPTIGTTSTTAFRGDLGNNAYNHSQSAHAPTNAQKNSDITKAEIEAKLTGKLSTHTHNYALLNHGTHVPTPQIANNAVFLRNDDTWQPVSPNKIDSYSVVSFPDSRDTASYVKIAEAELTSVNNVHGEFILSGQGDIGNTGHSIGVLRISGRYNGDVTFTKFINDDGNAVEIGYVRTSTKIEAWLKQAQYDGMGCLTVLSVTDGVTINKNNYSQVQAPSGYTRAVNEYLWENMKVSPILDNGLMIHGTDTQLVDYPLLGVDDADNIQLGLNNITYIDVHNETRLKRDLNIDTSIYAGGVRITGDGNYAVMHMGPSSVRVEYDVRNGVMYVAGSESEMVGYHIPFRANHLQSVWEAVKMENTWFTISTVAPDAPVTGDVWFNI